MAWVKGRMSKFTLYDGKVIGGHSIVTFVSMFAVSVTQGLE